jgi:hypothetical protein
LAEPVLLMPGSYSRHDRQDNEVDYLRVNNRSLAVPVCGAEARLAGTGGYRCSAGGLVNRQGAHRLLPTQPSYTVILYAGTVLELLGLITFAYGLSDLRGSCSDGPP